jgi:ubiquinol-cytochrome c reductase cytochrome b subunit
MRRLLDWVEERTGLAGRLGEFLDEEIPGSSGWRQVLGSVALFCFLVQAFTGVLLLMNYAPTPGEAYNSVRYIITEVTGGRMIRNLHHWGASMMIVVVLLHMVQVFAWGAYKRPREATWMAGVAMLLVTLAFGLTGYLLPWDNRAYWGTVVATQIAAGAPLVGPYLTRLLGAESGIGVVTFARFFAAHVVVLPGALALLIGLHLYLVRRHGVAPLAVETLPKKRFFPEQVFRDTVAIFVAFCALFAVAAVVQAPFGALADPGDTRYTPRPDWYFLFLFQLLKLFSGPLEVVGSVVLPNLAVVALLAVPFLDRGRPVPLVRRRVAMGAVAVCAVVWTGLTLAAVAGTPAAREEASGSEAGPGWAQLSPVEVAGIGYFRKQGCQSCHTLGGGAGKKLGPDLGQASRRTAAWLIAHFDQPGALMPGTAMPPMRLTGAEKNGLAAFLLRVTPENARALARAPEAVVEGAMVYMKYRCGACHRVNGVGMRSAPDLNGVGRKRERKWLEEHFADPKRFSPGSVMPAYRFAPREMEAINSYLLALP